MPGNIVSIGTIRCVSTRTPLLVVIFSFSLIARRRREGEYLVVPPIRVVARHLQCNIRAQPVYVHSFEPPRVVFATFQELRHGVEGGAGEGGLPCSTCKVARIRCGDKPWRQWWSTNLLGEFEKHYIWITPLGAVAVHLRRVGSVCCIPNTVTEMTREEFKTQTSGAGYQTTLHPKGRRPSIFSTGR